MRTILALSTAALLFSLPAYAEALAIPIAGQNWKIEMDAPKILRKDANDQGGIFQYQANAGMFNLSIFVEPPDHAGGNKECFEFYWTKARRNPQIDPESIETSKIDRYNRVQYNTVFKTAEKTFIQKNVNYYFAFEGKWIDVHISIVNPKPDDKTIEIFDKALKYSKN